VNKRDVSDQKIVWIYAWKINDGGIVLYETACREIYGEEKSLYGVL